MINAREVHKLFWLFDFLKGKGEGGGKGCNIFSYRIFYRIATDGNLANAFVCLQRRHEYKGPAKLCSRHGRNRRRAVTWIHRHFSSFISQCKALWTAWNYCFRPFLPARISLCRGGLAGGGDGEQGEERHMLTWYWQRSLLGSRQGRRQGERRGRAATGPFGNGKACDPLAEGHVRRTTHDEQRLQLCVNGR